MRKTILFVTHVPKPYDVVTTVSTFNKQPVHVKHVLTSLFGELLKKRIG